ncbi:hypothetical protein GGTG_00009 [Gaeumannomyces tritici R3-111a-1]|uniref:Uncharacterized protein n=1 Tax=Gaeumannomyces tritici (strain R3-111a-1) TaxID=644352 RepID=J3NFG2_GAET3|nr:hypothetical protein GGTG_00009 [Gaeumannomyces tritici R3-111a-1]EJT80002.1 hypothetical protein GGTG_00009 [Gaeumannomyces tritici R3-111a-1]
MPSNLVIVWFVSHWAIGWSAGNRVAVATWAGPAAQVLPDHGDANTDRKPPQLLGKPTLITAIRIPKIHFPSGRGLSLQINCFAGEPHRRVKRVPALPEKSVFNDVLYLGTVERRHAPPQNGVPDDDVVYLGTVNRGHALEEAVCVGNATV